MNKYLKLFFLRIATDFRQKELLPLKLLFFVHASTILILYPYLTIHMRELGINVEETAIMSAVIPVISILMPPIAGLIADKIGNFKILLAIFSGLGGISALLLLIVPVGRISILYPDRVIFGMSCAVDYSPTLSLFQEHPCTPLHSNSFETDITVESCGFVCQAYANEKDSIAILGAKTYGVQMHNIKSNTTTIIRYEINNTNKINSTLKSLSATKITLRNDENYSTSIRKLSQNSYYFPTRSLYNFSCGIEINNSSSDDKYINNFTQIYSCMFGDKQQLQALINQVRSTFRVTMFSRTQSEDDVEEDRQLFEIKHLKDGTDTGKPFCVDGFPRNKEYVSINVPLLDTNDTSPYKTLDLGSCAVRCLASSLRKNVCSNKQAYKDLDIDLTFWSYLAVRVFIGMVSGTAFAMYEGAVIAVLREHKADYGLQRVYATIGGMISSPLSGWLIDYASRGKDFTDYRPIFFIYAFLKIVFSVLVLFVNLEFKVPANNVISDVFYVLKKAELLTLFAAFFVLGTVWGYIESFLFWLIQDLGGSKSLMGITITVGGIAGIPLLVLSGPIIKRIGHANVIFIGFVFYSIRLLGYSLIYNPWLCLIFEAMESITSSLTVTAVVTYAAKLSTVTTDTSIQGLLGGLYFGVGKGSGSLIGGYLMKYIGTRATFQIFAAISAITGLLYFCINYFYMRKWPSEGTDITKKDSLKCNPDLSGIDLKNKLSCPETPIKQDPLPYEDAITNYGYEDTEDLEEQIHGNTDKNKV
ncbi:hypothetical protein RN001_015587 [Aquatica leii]|uniref:Major facilitator superfamily (MFS) profile domain-containing protein n=1 Tax=Aquatica leii TaxID=1421715 RepID=A0AAN7NZ69_9COLE|nr:hypothetical protein RN001_015587 [Aquatica leii]